MKNICDKKMTFNDCELAILRAAIDKAETKQGRKTANSLEIKKIIEIVEHFLRKKQLICYGGTAINNILPKQDQFYNKDIEIPDYDFYSSNALNDSKELVDIYISNGFQEVEAKSGQHHGTYKVFVNFIPVADITFIPKELFNAIKKESIKVAGILYSPPNLLRMNMYLELSRPAGDISRWEKVLKRLTLLNKHYPIKKHKCNSVQFMRDFEGDEALGQTIYTIVKDSIIKQGLVFFGGYASSLFQQYLSVQSTQKNKMKQAPDFDALAENPKEAALRIKHDLEKKGIKNVKVYEKPDAGEIIAPHYEVAIGKDSVCFIYEPLGCHSYNTIHVKNNLIKIATIDTMLNLFLAFLYANRPYYDPERILCMAQYLFNIQSKNRLNQKGLLKRFTKECYGTELNIQMIRENRAKKFKDLKPYRNKTTTKNGKEYEKYFLRYAPGEKKTVFRKKHATVKELKNKINKINKINNKNNKNNKNKTQKLKNKIKKWFLF